MFNFRKLAAIGGVCLSALVAGCGGGSSGSGATPSASTLSGVAAVGYPIVSGTINVSCVSGNALTATTGSTGSWQVTLSGQTLPCAVQVTSGTINGVANITPYHSIATALGTVNVTPLTDLMVANLALTATPGTWFAGLNSATLTAITQANVDTALANLRTALGLIPLNTINPITTVFTASSGNISDDMLAALATVRGTFTHAALLGNASVSNFVAPAGFGAALTAAYAGTPSGGAGGGTSAGVCGDTTSIDTFFTSNAGFINVSRTGGNTTSLLYQQFSAAGYRIQILTMNGTKGVYVIPTDSGSAIQSLAVEPEDAYENLSNEANVLFNAAPAQPLVGLTGVLQCDKTTGVWTLAIAAANSALNNVTLTSSASSGGSGGGTTSGAVTAPLASLANGAYYRLVYSAGMGVGIDQRKATANFSGSGAMSGYVATMFDGSPSTQEAPSLGTASVAELAGDDKVTIGRWNGGTTAGSFYSISPIAITANQGFHYAIGVPPVSLPADGTSKCYTLTSATHPTIGDGSVAPGSVTPGAQVKIVFGATGKLAIDMAFTAGGNTVTIQTPGGMASPVAFGSNGASYFASSPAPFGYTIIDPANNTTSAYIFLAGANSERLGMSFTRYQSAGGNSASLQGAAYFSETACQ